MDNEEQMEKGCQGSSIKDPRTKPKVGRIDVEVIGVEESVGWKVETAVLAQQ